MRYNARMEYMTLTQMAEKLGLKSTAALRRLCESGRIAAEKLGKTWLVEIREVERYKREQLGKRGHKAGKLASN